MSFIFSISMFFLSFAPLWIAILFIDIRSWLSSYGSLNSIKVLYNVEAISIICIILGFVVSSIVLWSFLNDKNHIRQYYIKEAKEEKRVVADYLLSWILPLMTFDFTLWTQVVLFLIFFVPLGFVYIRHKCFAENIVLELLGYRYYECVIVENQNGGNEISINVVSKENLILNVGNKIELASINNEYSIVRSIITENL